MLTVRYVCHFGRVTGYGRAAHDYLLALARHADVRLDIQPLGDPDHLEPRYRELQADVERNFDDREIDIEVVHTRPDDLGAYARVDEVDVPRVAITTWETEPFPPQLADGLDLYDAVIVPSSFCYVRLSGAVAPGLPVMVVPHCFDPQFWKPAPSEPHKPFRFYTIGAWSERKNPIGALKAYFAEFSRADDVHMAMLIGENVDLKPQIRALAAASGLPEDELPALSYHGPCSEHELYELHAGGDCFVSATRGEGWGLGAFEAAIMGNPIVMPGWGGHADFLDSYANWFATPYEWTPCFPAHLRPVPGVPGAFGATKSSGVSCRQRWAEPDLLAMGTAMRRVYERGNAVLTADERRRLDFDGRYGYETIGPKLAELLAKVLESPRVRKE